MEKQVKRKVIINNNQYHNSLCIIIIIIIIIKVINGIYFRHGKFTLTKINRKTIFLKTLDGENNGRPPISVKAAIHSLNVILLSLLKL